MSFFGELKRYLDADTLCRMYYCGDHEVFEFYKECDKDSLVSRREFPFLESLLLFLEMDHMSDYSLFFQIESDLISYPFYKEKQSAENALRELQEFPGGGLSLGDIDRRLAELEVQFQKLLKQATNDPAAYSGQFKEILDEQTYLKEKRAAILAESKHNAEINQKIMDAAELLDRDALTITEWDESVIRQMVETVKVLSKNEIIVTLKGGAEISQSAEISQRME